MRTAHTIARRERLVFALRLHVGSGRLCRAGVSTYRCSSRYFVSYVPPRTGSGASTRPRSTRCWDHRARLLHAMLVSRSSQPSCSLGCVSLSTMCLANKMPVPSLAAALPAGRAPLPRSSENGIQREDGNLLSRDPGRSQTACGGFSPTPWLAPRTGSMVVRGLGRAFLCLSVCLSGWHLWSSSASGRPLDGGAMRIPRPAAEKLGAVRQDPDLDGLLFGLNTPSYWRLSRARATRRSPLG